MTVTVSFSVEVGRQLEEKASRNGQTLAGYLESLAETDVRESDSTPAASAELSNNEFDRLLDELSAGPALPNLAADFSRADIYADHD